MRRVLSLGSDSFSGWFSCWKPAWEGWGRGAATQPHRAFIPGPNSALAGLGRVNGDLVALVSAYGGCPPGSSYPGHGCQAGGDPRDTGS